MWQNIKGKVSRYNNIYHEWQNPLDLYGEITYNNKLLGENKMANKDTFFKNPGRVSNVINNTITSNIKTLNTEHLALNTTSAQEACKLNDIAATPPSVAGIRDAVPHIENKDRAALELEIIEKRKQRELKKSKASEEYRQKKEEIRKSVQMSLDKEANEVWQSDSLFRIEVTLRNEANTGGAKCNIDILTEPGSKFRKYVSVMQNRRPREIYQSVKPEYVDWWGYAEAKQEISFENHVFAGKIKMRQQSGKTEKGATKMRIAPKVLPCTVCILYCAIVNNTAQFTARIIIGDSEYVVPLDVTDVGTEWYSHKGVWQADEEML